MVLKLIYHRLTYHKLYLSKEEKLEGNRICTSTYLILLLEITPRLVTLHKKSQCIFNDVINLRDRFTSVLTLKITPLNNTKRNKIK
jgi:hypothetical protein